MSERLRHLEDHLGGRRGAVLAAALAAQFAAAAVYRGLPSLVPDIRAEFGISVAEAGLVIAAPAAGNTLMLVAWGLYADRYGQRWLLPVGMAGAAAGLAVAALADSFVGIVAGLLVAGFFSAVTITGVRAASEWSTGQNRASAVSLVMTGIPLGGAVAALVLPRISSQFSTGWAFLALAAASAGAALALALALRSPPRRPPEPVVATTPGSPFRDPALRMLIASAALVITTSVALVAFLPLYFHEERGLSTVAAGAVLAGALLFSAVARVIAGDWADHIGRRLLPTFLLAAGTVALVVLLYVATQVSTGLAIVAAILAVGVSFAGNGLSATAVAERAGRAHQGAALSLRKTLVFFAGVVGPIAFGLLVSPVGWEGSLALTLVPALVGAILLIPLVREEGGRGGGGCAG